MARKKSNPRSKSHRSPAQNTDDRRRSRRSGSGGKRDGQSDSWLWGVHPVIAALKNPNREIEAVYLQKDMAQRLGPEIDRALRTHDIDPPIFLATRDEMVDLCGEASSDPSPVHQGVVVKATPLPDLALDDVPKVMDQDQEFCGWHPICGQGVQVQNVFHPAARSFCENTIYWTVLQPEVFVHCRKE